MMRRWGAALVMRSRALAMVGLAGCGAAAAVGTATEAAAPGYATTPTSAGLIDPRALPLGDGYVSTRPRVGYVDSCITHFSATGGSNVAGPWISAKHHTWDYLTKVAVNGAIKWPSGYYA